MPKINIHNMSYYYSDFYNPIYENVTLMIDTEWRLGLIGRNGRGKTTLLKLLSGELEMTSGKMVCPVEMEYFPYAYDGTYPKTMDVLKESIGKLKSMEDEMERIIAQNDEAGFDAYYSIQEAYMALDGYEMETKILKEMDEMKLDSALLERPFESLSGGEKTRILLIALFLRKKAFVLLDEPTNHLDKKGKELVAEYLRKKKGFIVVSHDTVFLDKVIDHVLAINKRDITLEKGTYSSWKHNKEKTEQFELRTREKLEQEIAQLERSAKVNRDWANLGEDQKYDFASHGRANGAKTYMRQAKRSETNIQNRIEEKKSLLQNYEEAKTLEIRQECVQDERCLVKVNQLSFGYEDSASKLIRKLELEVHAGDRIWIRGNNGIGKSTLLRLLYKQLPSEAVVHADGLRVSVSWQEPLWTSGYIKDYLRSTQCAVDEPKFLELCECFELPEGFLKRPLETYSSGELKKIDIARTLAEDNELILLDEPLNYMDVYFAEQLREAILHYQPTLIFIEHHKGFGKAIATETVDLC
ncbi:MAG: ribosomal protection-like ABC-F family protein [Cellulosilyticaceae bacterium]